MEGGGAGGSPPPYRSSRRSITTSWSEVRSISRSIWRSWRLSWIWSLYRPGRRLVYWNESSLSSQAPSRWTGVSAPASVRLAETGAAQESEGEGQVPQGEIEIEHRVQLAGLDADAALAHPPDPLLVQHRGHGPLSRSEIGKAIAPVRSGIGPPGREPAAGGDLGLPVAGPQTPDQPAEDGARLEADLQIADRSVHLQRLLQAGAGETLSVRDHLVEALREAQRERAVRRGETGGREGRRAGRERLEQDADALDRRAVRADRPAPDLVQAGDLQVQHRLAGESVQVHASGALPRRGARRHLPRAGTEVFDAIVSRGIDGARPRIAAPPGLDGNGPGVLIRLEPEEAAGNREPLFHPQLQAVHRGPGQEDRLDRGAVTLRGGLDPGRDRALRRAELVVQDERAVASCVGGGGADVGMEQVDEDPGERLAPGTQDPAADLADPLAVEGHVQPVLSQSGRDLPVRLAVLPVPHREHALSWIDPFQPVVAFRVRDRLGAALLAPGGDLGPGGGDASRAEDPAGQDGSGPQHELDLGRLAGRERDLRAHAHEKSFRFRPDVDGRGLRSSQVDLEREMAAGIRDGVRRRGVLALLAGVHLDDGESAGDDLHAGRIEAPVPEKDSRHGPALGVHDPAGDPGSGKTGGGGMEDQPRKVAGEQHLDEEGLEPRPAEPEAASRVEAPKGEAAFRVRHRRGARGPVPGQNRLIPGRAPHPCPDLYALEGASFGIEDPPFQDLPRGQGLPSQVGPARSPGDVDGMRQLDDGLPRDPREQLEPVRRKVPDFETPVRSGRVLVGTEIGAVPPIFGSGRVPDELDRHSRCGTSRRVDQETRGGPSPPQHQTDLRQRTGGGCGEGEDLRREAGPRHSQEVVGAGGQTGHPEASPGSGARLVGLLLRAGHQGAEEDPDVGAGEGAAGLVHHPAGEGGRRAQGEQRQGAAPARGGGDALDHGKVAFGRRLHRNPRNRNPDAGQPVEAPGIGADLDGTIGHQLDHGPGQGLAGDGIDHLPLDGAFVRGNGGCRARRDQPEKKNRGPNHPSTSDSIDVRCRAGLQQNRFQAVVRR
jgi:hypothetical protein